VGWRRRGLPVVLAMRMLCRCLPMRLKWTHLLPARVECVA
jgi:hypothetical protein